MIYNIKQISSITKAEFEISENKTGKLLYKGLGTRLIAENDIKLFSSVNELIYFLRYDVIENIKNSIPFKFLFAKTYKQTCNLFDLNSVSIGKLSLVKSGLFFSYYSMIVSEVEYCFYAISLGKDGIKIPIFQDDIQIGLLEKGTLTYNNLDEYKLYLSDDSKVSLLSLFTIYYDNWEYGNQREVKYGASVEYVWSINKKLKSKYDSTWKETFIKNEE